MALKMEGSEIQKKRVIFLGVTLTPKLVVVYGDQNIGYEYNSVESEISAEEWPNIVSMLADAIQKLQTELNAEN